MPPAQDYKPRKYKCTVVNLLPYGFTEEKAHIIPSVFSIPKADDEYGFSVTYIGEGVFFIPNPFDNNNYRQVTSPNEMARSIVEDYSSSFIGLDEFAGPGLFWLEGEIRPSEIISREEFKAKLDEYKLRQTNWFKNLVQIADGDWSKNHNIMAVSDIQKHAAKALNLTRDWVYTKAQDVILCPYCKAPIANDSIKCFNCKEVVNAALYAELKKKTALDIDTLFPVKEKK